VRARFWTARPAFNAWPGNLIDLVIPALAVAVVAAAAILLVQSGSITASGYRLNQLERLKADWERQNQQLAADVASLRSLERAESEARSRWKMEPAAQVLYIDLTAPESVAASPARQGR
jgi:hypothetical protein